MATTSNSESESEQNNSDKPSEVGLDHVVYELRMLRTEMEQYYSMIFKAQVEMLNSWGDFFALWMETVKRDRL